MSQSPANSSKGRRSISLGVGDALDRVFIKPFFPSWYGQRLAARVQSGLTINALGNYDAARKDHRDKWLSKNLTADGYMSAEILDIVARSRDLVRNTSVGKSIALAYGRNVVGLGIVPNANAVDASNEPRERFNELADKQFTRWADNPRACDVEGRLTFWAMQRQIVKQLVDTGEIFVRKVVDNTAMGSNGRTRHNPLKLQRLEVDQLDTSIMVGEDGREVRRGIEIDAMGRPVAYHFLDRPMNDVGAGPSKTQRVPADEIMHIYEQDRPGQSHGTPLMTPVVTKCRNIDEYDAWELEAAKQQACVALSVTPAVGPSQRTPGGVLPNASPLPQNDETTADSQIEGFISPGFMFRGNAGEEVNMLAPGRPSGVYSPYMIAQLRAAAAGSGLSYEQVARDHSQGTYASQRQGLLEDRASFVIYQAMITSLFCRPVWEEFINLAILSGTIDAPGFFAGDDQEDWLQVIWQAPGRSWIDPLKEAQGFAVMLNHNMISLREIVATRGQHYADVIKQRAKELKMIDKAGLSMPDVNAGTTSSPADKPTAQANGHTTNGKAGSRFTMEPDFQPLDTI